MGEGPPQAEPEVKKPEPAIPPLVTQSQPGDPVAPSGEIPAVDHEGKSAFLYELSEAQALAAKVFDEYSESIQQVTWSFHVLTEGELIDPKSRKFAEAQEYHDQFFRLVGAGISVQEKIKTLIQRADSESVIGPEVFVEATQIGQQLGELQHRTEEYSDEMSLAMEGLRRWSDEYREINQMAAEIPTKTTVIIAGVDAYKEDVKSLVQRWSDITERVRQHLVEQNDPSEPA